MPSRTVASKLFAHQVETVCQRGQLLPGTTSICLTSLFFQTWAVAVRFLNAKRSAQRHGFVGTAVRLTIGPLTSLVTYTAVLFLAGYLMTCGDVESNPGPGPGEKQDYPWCQPSTRHGTTTDIITRQAGSMQCRRAICQPDTLTPLPALQDPAMHSHDWKHISYSFQLTPRSACSRWTVSRRRSQSPSPTWIPGASPFSARTTSLRRTFVISLRCEILQNQVGNI